MGKTNDTTVWYDSSTQKKVIIRTQNSSKAILRAERKEVYKTEAME